MSTELILPSAENKDEFNAAIGVTAKEVAEQESLEWYFPEIEPGRTPFGARVIVQLRRTKRKSKGGIILASETKETDKWNDQVAKVVGIGSLAFCNRETKEPWPEGVWAKIGDFVSVPRWGGDRWEKNIEGEEEKVTFAVFNDHELISLITEDPRNVKAFVL